MPNLINNAADLKANFAALSLNFKWENISSYAQDAERDIIGEAISPEALAFFQANLTGLPNNQAAVLTLLQRSLAYLTILKWSQTALFQFEDKALFVAKSTTGAIISDKKLVDLRQSCEEEGFKFLDKALDLMESDLASFTEYRDSDTRAAMNEGFILTARDFSKQRSINNSRVTFMSMYYFMIDAQEAKLPDVMTPAYYALFKQRFIDATLTADELKLLPYIKKGIANLTIAAACSQLPVQFSAGGLFINKYVSRTDYEAKDPAEIARLQFLADDHAEKGERFLLQLQQLMQDPLNGLTLPGYVLPVVNNVCVNKEKYGIYQFPG